MYAGHYNILRMYVCTYVKKSVSLIYSTEPKETKKEKPI